MACRRDKIMDTMCPKPSSDRPANRERPIRGLLKRVSQQASPFVEQIPVPLALRERVEHIEGEQAAAPVPDQDSANRSPSVPYSVVAARRSTLSQRRYGTWPHQVPQAAAPQGLRFPQSARL